MRLNERPSAKQIDGWAIVSVLAIVLTVITIVSQLLV